MVRESPVRREIAKMQRRLDDLMGSFFGEGGDLVDMPQGYREAFSEFKENENEYVVEIEIPGINKEDIDLRTTENGIEVKAEKKEESESEGSEDKYKYTRSYSGFYQTLDVPENADLDNIDASYENGILTVKLPKKAKDDGKREIQIK
ncbi:MAG: Hsp20/alpha crystallin family protein [Candidatus Pacearchaeota archaeon]